MKNITFYTIVVLALFSDFEIKAQSGRAKAVEDFFMIFKGEKPPKLPHINTSAQLKAEREAKMSIAELLEQERQRRASMFASPTKATEQQKTIPATGSEYKPKSVQVFTSTGFGEKAANLDKLMYHQSLKGRDNTEIYLSMPANKSEYINIFETPNNRELKSIVKDYDDLKKEANFNVHFCETASTFLSGLKDTPEDKPIILIGHNKAGKFVFPDGSSNSFKTMDSVANEVGRSIVYLSCNASEFSSSPATSHYLTFYEAFELTKKLNALDYTRFCTDRKQLKTELNRIMTDFAKRREISMQMRVAVITIGAGGAGYGLYVMERKVEKKSKETNR